MTNKCWLSACLALAAVALPESASADTGFIERVHAEPSGVVHVTGSAYVFDCQAEDQMIETATGFEWVPTSPCGGRVVAIAMPPEIEFVAYRSIEKGTCRSRVDPFMEAWSNQDPLAWMTNVAEGFGSPKDPPERIVWESRPLATQGAQPLKFRFRSDFRIWPAGVIDTPCLYLAYMKKVSGENPAEGCLPDFKESVRGEICKSEYWSEVWLTELAMVEIPTAYPSCSAAEGRVTRAVSAYGRFVDRTYRRRRTRRLQRQDKRLRRALNQAVANADRRCPRISV